MNRLHDRDDTHSPRVAPMTRSFALPDEAATADLGAALARILPRDGRLRVYLVGDLGAGKTTLVRSVLRALGYTGTVRSPTYTLVELHVVSGLHLYHFDFYRFTTPDEFLEAGLDEYFNEAAICLLEWPDRAAPFVPPADIEICLEIQDNTRRATLRATSLTGSTCLASLLLPPTP